VSRFRFILIAATCFVAMTSTAQAMSLKDGSSKIHRYLVHADHRFPWNVRDCRQYGEKVRCKAWEYARLDQYDDWQGKMTHTWVKMFEDTFEASATYVKLVNVGCGNQPDCTTTVEYD
jgi:hypothetical protein